MSVFTRLSEQKKFHFVTNLGEMCDYKRKKGSLSTAFSVPNYEKNKTCVRKYTKYCSPFYT
jgi:hypothetical protein